MCCNITFPTPDCMSMSRQVPPLEALISAVDDYAAGEIYAVVCIPL